MFERALHSSIVFFYRVLRYLGAISSILKKSYPALGAFTEHPEIQDQ